MKKKASTLLYLVLIIGTLISVRYALHHQLRIVHVVSNSMSPEFSKNDLILVGSIKSANLKRNQITILPSLDKAGIYYAHRIISIEETSDGRILVSTKGDANPVADDEKLIIESAMTPVYLGVIPISKAPGLLGNAAIFFGLATSLTLALLSLSFMQSALRRRSRKHAAS